MSTQHPVRFSIIGPGNVGQALGRALTVTGAATPRAIVGRHLNSAERAAAFIGAGAPFADIAKFPIEADDIIFITVGDDDLNACIDALSARDLPEGVIVAHTSGSISLEILNPLRRPGVSIAALHPVLAIAEPAIGADQLITSWCTLQGDDQARSRLEALVGAYGAHVAILRPDADRALYHAGLVFMSNYICTLMESGFTCLEASGVDRLTARNMVWGLARLGVDGALRHGPAAALTGPIARGDIRTVARNLEALSRADRQLANTYAALARPTIELARTKAKPPGLLDAIAALVDTYGQDDSPDHCAL